MARRRKEWRKLQGKVDGVTLILIDETWAKTNMTRTHGRCRRGQRLVAKVPQNHRKTLTSIAGLLRLSEAQGCRNQPMDKSLQLFSSKKNHCLPSSFHILKLELAKHHSNTLPAFRPSRLAHVASMQDQPVMRRP